MKASQIQLYFLCLFVIGVNSCKKPRPEVPPEEPLITTEIARGLLADSKKINGYFHMANLIYLHNQRSRYGFATFGDPGRDLKTNYDCINNQINYSRRGPNFGNINIGTVRFNESRLNSVDSITYSYSANLNVFDNSVRWQTTGNGSLKPLDVTIPGGFPFVNVTKDYSLSLKEDFTLDISGLAGNYDSLVVVLSDFGNEKPNDGSVKKTISDPNSSTVTFASSDMTAALSPSQYGSLRLRAYNYSNKTLENKVYLFELSSHAIVSLTISP